MLKPISCTNVVTRDHIELARLSPQECIRRQAIKLIEELIKEQSFLSLVTDQTNVAIAIRLSITPINSWNQNGPRKINS